MTAGLQLGRGGLRPLFRVAALAAATVLVLSCDASPTGVDHAMPVAGGASATSIAVDPGLNWSDTWISETMTLAETTTVWSAEPFEDPDSGAMVNTLTVAGAPESFDGLAGYGYDGLVRVTTATTRSNWLQTDLVRLVGTTPYDQSGYGTLQPDPIDNEPLSTLGDLSYAPLDPSGGGNDDACLTKSDECQIYMTRMSKTFGQSVRYQYADPTHVRRVADFPPSAAAGSASATTTHRETRDLEKRGADWVLTHIQQDFDVASPTRKVHHVVHQTLTKINYHKNAKLDAERKKKAKEVAGDGSPAATAGSVQFGDAGRSIVAIQPVCPLVVSPARIDVQTAQLCGDGTTGGGGGGGTGPVDPPAPDLSVLTGQEFTYDAGAAGPLLIFQHGFMSDGRTWNRMANWMRSDEPSSPKYLPTTQWKNRYEDQANELRAKVADHYPSAPAIVIGHSNGGMIGRNFARNQGTTPLLGVITVGTPHNGAPAANVGALIAKLLGFGTAGVLLECNVIDGEGCYQTRTAALETAWYYLQYGTAIPVLDEMRYYDLYHLVFNSHIEPVQRFGVMSEMWSKWVMWRVAGDTRCYSDDPYCGGGVRVAKVDKVFHHDVTCSWVSGIFGFISSAARTAAARCAADAAFLRAFDNLFQKIVLKGVEGSDGVVPVVSQRYPYVPETNLKKIEDGPSHIGETSDPRVRTAVTSFINFIKQHP